MAEYIDREALLKDIEESVVFTVRSGKPSLEIRGANAITDRIKSAPAADVEEVKHGRWTATDIVSKRAGYGVRYYNHAECDVAPCRLFECEHDYCPNCGAKMNGGKENV